MLSYTYTIHTYTHTHKHTHARTTPCSGADIQSKISSNDGTLDVEFWEAVLTELQVTLTRILTLALTLTLTLILTQTLRLSLTLYLSLNLILTVTLDPDPECDPGPGADPDPSLRCTVLRRSFVSSIRACSNASWNGWRNAGRPSAGVFLCVVGAVDLLGVGASMKGWRSAGRQMCQFVWLVLCLFVGARGQLD